MVQAERGVARVIEQHAYPASPEAVLDRIPASCDFVLIGEASHGTADFYDFRASLTRLLIQQRAFNAVALEADFPDIFKANLWVRGLSDEKDANEALSALKRFPQWMWRNRSVERFVAWLHAHNLALPESDRTRRAAGLYGMDVYSLHCSADSVIRYLERVDPEHADAARERYACFDKFGSDALNYAVGLAQGYKSCEREALAQMMDLLAKAPAYKDKGGGPREAEEAFAAGCNARVVKGAETYYRNMFFRDEITWNIRDEHFMAIVRDLVAHIGRHYSERPRVVVWAHNSHLGDASATDMVCNVGFTTHAGTVAAADEWGEPVQRMAVKPSIPGSYENLLHAASAGRGGGFALDFRGARGELTRALAGPLLERAIGVIYKPRTERLSHYFDAWLPLQFDITVHIDETRAVHPLDSDWEEAPEHKGELPLTFPFGV